MSAIRAVTVYCSSSNKVPRIYPDAAAELGGAIAANGWKLVYIISSKQLGYHNKPIVLLNINDYYATLIAMIEHGVEQNFIKIKARELYFIADSVTAAIDHIREYRPPAPAERSFEASAPP